MPVRGGERSRGGCQAPTSLRTCRRRCRGSIASTLPDSGWSPAEACPWRPCPVVTSSRSSAQRRAGSSERRSPSIASCADLARALLNADPVRMKYDARVANDLDPTTRILKWRFLVVGGVLVSAALIGTGGFHLIEGWP